MNKHLDSKQRYQVQIGLAQGLPVSAIAQDIGFHKSTIHRELNNNGGVAGYDAKVAQQRVDKRALRSRNARATPRNTRHAVEHYLALEHSPEKIAGLFDISHETIYRHIYRDKQVGGCLHLSLRCKKPHKKRCSGSNRNRRGHIANQRRIAERPAHIEGRVQVDQLEFDTIVGPTQASSMLRGVERKSGLVLMARLADRSAATACIAMITLLEPLVHWAETITTDNGREFACRDYFDTAIGCASYFCDPYVRWQRGSNEKANGLICQYLPKKRDLSKVTQEEIDNIMERLNTRPRKRLGFKTPNQVFLQSVNRFRNS